LLRLIFQNYLLEEHFIELFLIFVVFLFRWLKIQINTLRKWKNNY
jgi:hypothetical protein